jgi:hypothetical protein
MKGPYQVVEGCRGRGGGKFPASFFEFAQLGVA